MQANKNVKLVLTDVYSYDISACHYNILKKFGFNLSHLDKNDKFKRNMQIGLMMRDNPNITSLLRNTTTSLIDQYIIENGITEDDILFRQYDGLITLTPLRILDLNGMPLEYRDHFDVFILSVNRKMYIAKSNFNNFKIKGVPNKYDAITEYYKKICNINFAFKSTIFKSLQKIKDQFMNESNPKVFGIPTRDGKANVFIKGYGEMEISLGTLRVIDVDDIDKQRYFDFYLLPFTKSIVVEYVR